MNSPKNIRLIVSDSYAGAVTKNRKAKGICCSGHATETKLATLAGYSTETPASLPADAAVNSFGCGNPTAFAEIHWVGRNPSLNRR